MTEIAHSDDLQQQIDEMRKEIRTDDYSMSIGEISSIYTSNEMDIHPEFQRFYRWRNNQKSKLIESILLGIPVPPIFVSQREDGVWDVIDGLQRLSTIFEFMGILKNEKEEQLPALTLERTQHLPALENKKWINEERPEDSFTNQQRLQFKRAKLAVSIVLKESDSIAKYELFQRLNTGGSSLTEQEVRNCVLIMINPSFYKWIKDLSEYPAFRNCIALSDNSLEEKYEMELVVRFICLHSIDADNLQIRDIHDFLNDRIKDIALNGHSMFAAAEASFKKTFSLIDDSIGTDAFRRYSHEKEKFLGGFILSAFETISMGIGYNILSSEPANILETIKLLWRNEEYQRWSGSGMTATRRLPKLIPLGRTLFAGT